MEQGEYQNVNATVQRRFLSLNAEIGDESKIRFVFYTSAKKNRIRTDRIEKIVKEQFQDNDKFEVSLLYVDDIIEEIKELESRRPSVEGGIIKIDAANNALEYGEDAVIVNVSAFSIKELYALHSEFNSLINFTFVYFSLCCRWIKIYFCTMIIYICMAFIDIIVTYSSDNQSHFFCHFFF